MLKVACEVDGPDKDGPKGKQARRIIIENQLWRCVNRGGRKEG